jgi:hypothetical protein
MLECAREVLAVTGSRSEISFEPLPVDDPARRRPDIAKARELLGWEPKVELREGLERSLEYFRGVWSAERDAKDRMLVQLTSSERPMRPVNYHGVCEVGTISLQR